MNTTRALTLFLALALFGLVLLALSAPTARAADPVIVRVTTSGTTTWPCGDQTNWSNPCSLQTALSKTVSPSELWVAAGTYKPTTGADRFASFQLRDGVALYGGFAGGETMRSQRNITANVTILSGDVGIPGNNTDNSYRVVTGSGVTNTAVLDGFTVTAGNANGPYPYGIGGGMYNNGGSPTLANVIFISNSVGGMANQFVSNPTLTNVIFNGNSGGGMMNYQSNPTLTNVSFISNIVAGEGGGMKNNNSSPTLTNVTFYNNSASNGGGMDNSFGSNAKLTNVTFFGNSATEPTYGDGGAIRIFESSPTLTNVTIVGNSATRYGGGILNYQSPSLIRNTIVWGNSAPTGPQIQDVALLFVVVTPTISSSVIQGGCPDSIAGCTDIIAGDPRLGRLANYGGSTQTIPLLVGSSAIDTGNDALCPPTDQRGVPRPQGAHCDIGAFEGQLTELDLPLIGR